MSFLLAKAVKPRARGSAWGTDSGPPDRVKEPGLFTSPVT